MNVLTRRTLIKAVGVSAVVSALTLGVTSPDSAQAVGSTLPFHSVSTTCDGINHISASTVTAMGYDPYRSEQVAWRMNLQQWDAAKARWVNVVTNYPWTWFWSSWIKSNSQHSMGGLMQQEWTLTGSGGWFRIVSWFYWPSHSATSPTVVSESCHLMGFRIIT